MAWSLGLPYLPSELLTPVVRRLQTMPSAAVLESDDKAKP
jgi:hypothetical protein